MIVRMIMRMIIVVRVIGFVSMSVSIIVAVIVSIIVSVIVRGIVSRVLLPMQVVLVVFIRFSANAFYVVAVVTVQVLQSIMAMMQVMVGVRQPGITFLVLVVDVMLMLHHSYVHHDPVVVLLVVPAVVVAGHLLPQVRHFVPQRRDVAADVVHIAQISWGRTACCCHHERHCGGCEQRAPHAGRGSHASSNFAKKSYMLQKLLRS